MHNKLLSTADTFFCKLNYENDNIGMSVDKIVYFRYLSLEAIYPKLGSVFNFFASLCVPNLELEGLPKIISLWW